MIQLTFQNYKSLLGERQQKKFLSLAHYNRANKSIVLINGVVRYALIDEV